MFRPPEAAVSSDAMRVHHLNCGTMCPFSALFINGEGGFLAPARMVCHCLLVESEDGLVLVDTGIGLVDIAAPRRVLGPVFVGVVRPRLDPNETAVRQVERLGFRIDDVRHIVMTHLDPDHTGGLPDFPGARVHVLDGEHEAAMRRSTMTERSRYVTAHWAHQPDWAVHSVGGERWMGFESVHALGGDVEPEVLLVPLVGHTSGHCGVAVRTGDGWLLHCGDAYFFRDEIAPEPRCPPGLKAFQQMTVTDRASRRHNQERLRELKRTKAAEVQLFCSHDGVELDRLQG
ncbi:MAG TPA: MBL fold metallo-hydrolase [Candidatus Dormibacteraeota bacterium]|nr:MBL fold metallo-hydrolase [Candidatus Dormibacteraeota bacterium]